MLIDILDRKEYNNLRRGKIMKNKTWFVLLILLAINGCGDNNAPLSDYEKAVQYCIEANGTVIKSDTEDESFCKYTQTYDYDDGTKNYTIICELYEFHQGVCDKIEDEEELGGPIEGAAPENTMTVRDAFHSQVLQVLRKLDNTGYVHHSKKEGPFILQPSYTELLKKDDDNHIIPNHSIDKYNLFLDCSGFVGYYIVHGIAKHLYDEVEKCYHSEGHNPPDRPLAADFADAFKKGKHIGSTGTREATLYDLENNESNVKWGRVMHIKDAQPGDIIVYKDTKHIVHNGECNNTTYGNTGHILFIMKKPYKYDSDTDTEWLVNVADSTTAPHSSDSRLSNIKKHTTIFDKSKYDYNHYTAWTLRYKKNNNHWNPFRHKSDDWMEQCDTEDKNIFHRRCESFNESQLTKIRLQTSHTLSSTGIGIGNIYISDDMNHYRVKKGAKKVESEVYIGRPIILDSK